jgi:hypothetical protein
MSATNGIGPKGPIDAMRNMMPRPEEAPPGNTTAGIPGIA